MSRTPAPPLLVIFRSRAQGDILARVLLGNGPLTLSDVAKDLDLPFATVQREATRLVSAGILSDDRVGRARQLRANTRNRAHRPLRELVMITFGPKQVVLEEFAPLTGVSVLMIYGSWAARYRGEEGPEPGDIDVLLVGDVDRDVAYDAADRAGRRLGREVNPTVVSERRWHAAEDPFLRQLHQRPLVPVFERGGAP